MTDRRIEELELWAYVGEDEFGSGQVGLKQGDVPAGRIALVSLDRDKLEGLRDQLQQQVDTYGKPISLIRLAFVEEAFVIEPTNGGSGP